MTDWALHPGQKVVWRPAQLLLPQPDCVYASTEPVWCPEGRSALPLSVFGDAATVISYVSHDGDRASVLLMYPSEELWWVMVEEIPLSNGTVVYAHRNHYDSLNPLCLVALD